MKAGDSIVVFGTAYRGHTNRLLPIISMLVRAGIHVHVFSEPNAREDIEEAGGSYINLLKGRSFEESDPSSTPTPCRYVSFAGYYADQIISEAAALKPSLILHDAWAMVAQVVAKQLRVPRVNLCAGHDYPPEKALDDLRGSPRVSISDKCRRAVEVLRNKYGMMDASPFSFITGSMSGDLNLYFEPPQYLPEDRRTPFQPIAFIGSLSDRTINRYPRPQSSYNVNSEVRQRIYVSFGTIVWGHSEWEVTVREVLKAIHGAVQNSPECTVLLSMGGTTISDWVRQLEMPNFRVESYVDQWNVLAESTVFITHHGLNSTHEAVFQKVPMISYPFFHDQPALAKRTQDLGIAVPLSTELRGIVSVEDVRSALLKVDEGRNIMMKRLSEARQWELDVIAGRGDVTRRIMDLAP